MLRYCNKLVLPLCALLVLGAAGTAQAATLQLTGAGTYHAGDTVVATILLTTSGSESANAVSTDITYPGALELASISKTGSIISFWPSEPSGAGGTAHVEGVILNPGWSGTGGRVVTLSFTARSAGAGTISFADPHVLANDGKGTEILTGTSDASVTVTAASTPPPASGIIITSSTHPDQKKWYKSGDVTLSWNLLPGATAVRAGYDTNPAGAPQVLYTPAISTKSISLADGTWYFHVQEKTPSGWSATATYALHIDRTPPLAMTIRFPHGATSSDPRPIILFNTTDALSGVDHYTLQVNDNALFTLSVADVKSNPYSLPPTDPGPGHVTVVAYDTAGNSTSASATFDVIGIAPPRLDPVEDINAGTLLQITGVALPSSRVDVFVTDSSGVATSQWTRSSNNGAFKVVWSTILSPGLYSVSAQTTDDTGAQSRMTDPVPLKVNELALLHFGPITVISKNALVVGTSLLVLLLIAAWYFGTRLLLGWYGAPAGSVHARNLIHRQFEDLKSAVAQEIHALERVRARRTLTVEEERFINHFTKLLDKAETAITNEVNRTK